MKWFVSRSFPPVVVSDSASHLSRQLSFSSHHSSSGGLRSDARSVFSASSVATSHHVPSHPETMEVRLEADQIGYGLSLQGGATERGEFPIVIACIEEGGPAAR